VDVPPVRILVAVEDLSLHQVVQDVLDITFKEAKTERAMSAQSFLERLRERPDDYDLVMLDVSFDTDAPEVPLPTLQAQLPEVLKRTILLASRHDSARIRAEYGEMALATYPFSLDDFTAIIRSVYDRSRQTRAERAQDSPPPSPPKSSSAN
jgi:DNA-binding NtrC family response regulator